jgi:hypothetical protein
MFDSNKSEFMLMMECLDIKQDDDFSLDLPKFRAM